MPPKTKFTRSDIVEAAFDIARAEGLSAITARKVADRLKSSVAPIYVNFKDLEELTGAVVARTFEVSGELLAQQNSGSPFQDIGRASLRFAREYPVLFRDILMNPSIHTAGSDEQMVQIVVAQMKADPDLAGLSDAALQELLLKLRIFQTGLSVAVAGGFFGSALSDELAERLLDDAAYDFVSAARSRQ